MKTIILFTLLLTASLLLTAIITLGQGKENKQIPLQFRGAILKAQPCKGPQNKSIPVDIVSLKLREAKYEFIVSDVVLKSRSPKPIESVQFIWYLVKEEGDSAAIKQEGFLTDILRIPRGLTKDREFKFGDFVLSIRKTMLNQVESNGIYTILVAVDNVYYTDGSKEKPPVRVWKLRDVNKERRPLNSAGGSF